VLFEALREASIPDVEILAKLLHLAVTGVCRLL
jgi:hypothetical protein